MSLTLYYNPFSQPSRTVLAFVRLAGIECNEKIIDLMGGETRSPEYQKLNDLQTVPAIDDNGFHLGESEAIIRYLLYSTKKGEEYYPTDPKRRALVDRYMPFHHNSVRRQVSKYFIASFMDVLQGEADSLGGFTLEQARTETEECLKKFEDLYLKGKKYISGDTISFADLYMLHELTSVSLITDFDFSKFPQTQAFIERCLENPIIKEVNEPVKEFPKACKELLEKEKKQ